MREMTMRPSFSADKSTVYTDHGAIPWDIENDRPMDHTAEGGRLYQQALDENEMTYPDEWKEVERLPAEPTQPPPPGNDLMLDHENRIRKLEGQPAMTMEEFLTKHRFM